MILYDTDVPVSLQEFGIQIPVCDSRAAKTLECLCRDEQLGPLRHRWHVDRITERLTRQDLLRAHASSYVEKLYSSELQSEIIKTYELLDQQGRYYRYAPEYATHPLTDLFDRIQVKASGSVQCARLALAHGFCFYFAGGMHHAHADHGSGFCLINDIVITARKLQAENLVRRIWIIDVDAHKGDGTAALTVADDTIRTLSIHMAAGWPLDATPAPEDNGRTHPVLIPSDIDIPIQSGEEAEYLPRLAKGLSRLADFDRADLAIVVCGADPYEKDELPSAGYLNLSLAGMLQRDRLVYRFLKAHDLPGAYLMAGGYGEHAWRVYAQFLLWALRERFK
jgi:acetoin utilization deacetylase AcuC-like enzyme